VQGVVAAARSEIAKIDLLRKELVETVKSLRREGAGFDRRLPKIEEELRTVSGNIEQIVSPQLTRLRNNYAGLADKRGEVREALSIYRSITDAKERRLKIENSADDPKEAAVSEGDVPSSIAEAFALQVEKLLKDWHFPNADRVFFDSKRRDLVIAGKLRTARGKGLRAITHAAFTIGLLQFCKAQETPHPGFVILDTPLRAYREPESLDDDLRGTDLNVQFYNYIAAMADDRQVIIIENDDPPASIGSRPQVQMFSGNPNSGRFGFFPVVTPQKQIEAPKPVG
jgi:hypothetical protein